MILFKGTRANYYFHKGAMSFERGNYNDATELLNKAIELNPKLMEAYYYRGMSYGKMKLLDEAVLDFSYIINAFPLYSAGEKLLGDIYRLLGDAYFAKREAENALANYEKALELEPLDRYSIINRNKIANSMMNGAIDSIIPDDDEIFIEKAVPWKLHGADIINRVWFRYHNNVTFGSIFLFVIAGMGFNFTKNVINIFNQHIFISIYWVLMSFLFLFISNRKHKAGLYSIILSLAAYDVGLISISIGLLHYFFYSALISSYFSHMIWLLTIIPLVIIYTYIKCVSFLKYLNKKNELGDISYFYFFFSGIFKYFGSNKQERNNYDVPVFGIFNSIKSLVFSFITLFILLSITYFFIKDKIDISLLLNMGFASKQKYAISMYVYMFMPFIIPILNGEIYKARMWKNREYYQ